MSEMVKDWRAKRLALFGIALVLSTMANAVEVDPRFDVRLIKDINLDDSSPGSMPYSFTQVGDNVYFITAGYFSSAKLWVTGGDATSTYEVSPGLSVSEIAKSDGKLFMSAGGISSEYGLWAIDPAVGHPYLVKTVTPGSFIAYAGDFFDLNGTLMFYATDGTHGYEPWSSRGTEATTQFLVDTIAGPNFSLPYVPWAARGNRAYVTSDSMPEGSDARMSVWATDGTPAGTSALYVSQGILGKAFNFRGHICFVEVPNLYVVRYLLRCSGGPLGDTISVTNLPVSYIDLYENDFVVGTDGIFFKANVAEQGEELWVTDGTSAGTHAVTNIPGPWIDSVGEIAAVDGKIYFTTTLYGVESQLWVVDAGARSVTALTTAEELLWPEHLTDFNGTLAFLGRRWGIAEEIWLSDGTLAGTQRVAHFDSYSTWPMRGLTAAGQSLYFDGDGGEGREPWIWTNRRPQAVADQLKVVTGKWTTLDVLANDSDIDGALDASSIEIIDQPSDGDVQVVAGRIQYRVRRVSSGGDKFSYRVRDTQGGLSDIATVSVSAPSGSGAFNLSALTLLGLLAVMASLRRSRYRRNLILTG